MVERPYFKLNGRAKEKAGDPLAEEGPPAFIGPQLGSDQMLVGPEALLLIWRQNYGKGSCVRRRLGKTTSGPWKLWGPSPVCEGAGSQLV